LPGLSGRQINRHVDILQIEDRDDTLAGTNNLSDPMDQVLNPAAARRDERQIGQDCRDARNLRLCGLDSELLRFALRFSSVKSCISRVGLVYALIKYLLAQISFVD